MKPTLTDKLNPMSEYFDSELNRKTLEEWSPVYLKIRSALIERGRAMDLVDWQEGILMLREFYEVPMPLKKE